MNDLIFWRVTDMRSSHMVKKYIIWNGAIPMTFNDIKLLCYLKKCLNTKSNLLFIPDSASSMEHQQIPVFVEGHSRYFSHRLTDSHYLCFNLIRLSQRLQVLHPFLAHRPGKEEKHKAITQSRTHNCVSKQQFLWS